MKNRLRFLFAAFLSWLPLFAIQKPLFMLYNHPAGDALSVGDYLRVMAHGLKLDCTMAAYLTVIPLLCTLLSVWLPVAAIRKALRGYYFGISLVVAAIFAVDLGLYAYWQFRIDATPFFYLKSPKEALAGIPLSTFLLQSVIFLLYAHLIYRLFSTYILSLLPDTPIRKRALSSLVFIVLAGLLFIPIRGGVTTSTANVGMVYFSNKQFLNHAAINPCFSLMASLSKQQDFAAQFDFFAEEERKEMFESLMRAEKQADPTRAKEVLLNTQRPNIVLILLESFTGNSTVQSGEAGEVTPNLNKLGREGIAFTRMYANSFRTDRGLVALLNGYLAQPTTSIMKYPAKSQTLPSLAKSLGKVGYRSEMLYGGDINFTNMQSYFFSSGYSKITADSSFPIAERLNKWGVNDDLTFAHLFNMIQEKPNHAPWLTTFLTLSSHEPFDVPYRKFTHPYLNSVAYTDSCLGDFVDKLKLTAAWDNTLLIVVSDHGFRYPDNTKEYEPARFRIPMVWSGGAINQSKTVDAYASQTDLAATLLSQLGLPYADFTFSKDILSPAYQEYAYYTFSNGFGFIDSTGVSIFDNDSHLPLSQETDPESFVRLNKGKALLQTLYDDLGRR